MVLGPALDPGGAHIRLAVCRSLPRRSDCGFGSAGFGVAFAVNSSLHSYLILAYAGSEKAAEDVGFYDAANAAGRLMGTLLSGLLYGLGGMTGCLTGSAAMLVLCWLLTLLLPARVAAPIMADQPA